MSRQQASAERYGGAGYLVLVAIPPMLLAIVLCASIMREWQAAQRVEAEITDLSPADRPSLAALLYPSIRAYEQQAANDWALLELAASEINGRVAAFTTDLIQDSLGPEGQRERALLVRRILDDAAPIDALLEEALARQQTSVPGPATVALLQKEVQTRVALGDRTAALDALRTLYRLAETTDPNLLFSSNVLIVLYDAVRRTLAENFWQTAEELSEVQALIDRLAVTPLDWAAVADQQRHWMSATIELLGKSRRHDGIAPLAGILAFYDGVPATARLNWIQQAEAYTADPNLAFLQQSAEILQRERQVGGIDSLNSVGIPFADDRAYTTPWFWAPPRILIGGLARAEYERLITMTLWQARQFRIENQRWPTQLSELVRQAWGPGWPASWTRGIRLELTADGERLLVHYPAAVRDFLQLADPDHGANERAAEIFWSSEQLE